MAGLIAALFGGSKTPPEPDPLPGVGGRVIPPGPYGATGLPGSTSAAPYPLGQDTPDAKLPSRRAVDTAAIRQRMQASPAEFYGGPLLRTRPGLNDTAGGELTRRGGGGHDPRDSTTLWKDAQHQISGNVPGAQNVRNQVAQRYKNKPGEPHQYRSAPRADQAAANNDFPGGWEMGGAGNPQRASLPVTVPNRFVYPGGGVQTWSVARRMPYTGRGDGARGAQLTGQRYYGQGGFDMFTNAGQGAYGASRLAGGDHKLPSSFTEPPPWTSGYPDLGTGAQGTAPASSRAANTAHRRRGR